MRNRDEKDQTPALSPPDLVRMRVQRLRKRRGWTQQELARRMSDAGIETAQPSVARMERGARRITVDELFVLGQVLGVTPLAFLVRDYDDDPVGYVVLGDLHVSESEYEDWLTAGSALPGQDEWDWQRYMPPALIQWIRWQETVERRL